MKKKVIFSIILNFLCIILYSQSTYYVEIKPFSGIITPHRAIMKSLHEKPIWGCEVNFLFSNPGNNIFDVKYNTPFTGVGFSFENLGNNSKLGNSFSLYPFMEFKVIKGSVIGLNTRIAAGLSYITKKFDAITNPDNIAIGSHLSFYFNWDFYLYCMIPKSKIQLRIGAGLVHNSNGSVKKPNFGLNQIKFSAGASYKINEPEEYNETLYQPYIIERPHEFHIMATIISTQEYLTGYIARKGEYFCSTVALGYNYRYSPLGKFGVSADFFYNQNYYYNFNTESGSLLKVHNKLSDILRTGISIGHELIYKKLGLVTYVGMYTYKKIRPHDYLYFRVGVRYYPIKNMYINLTLKCFGFKAHYIESGIGFSLYANKKNRKSN